MSVCAEQNSLWPLTFRHPKGNKWLPPGLTSVRSKAFVQAPPAPSAFGRPNFDTSCTSADVWQSMHPENMLSYTSVFNYQEIEKGGGGLVKREHQKIVTDLGDECHKAILPQTKIYRRLQVGSTVTCHLLAGETFANNTGSGIILVKYPHTTVRNCPITVGQC